MFIHFFKLFFNLYSNEGPGKFIMTVKNLLPPGYF
jgi:hypothetical protein